MTYDRYASDDAGNIVQSNYNSDGNWVGQGPDPRIPVKWREQDQKGDLNMSKTFELRRLTGAEFHIANQYPATSGRGKYYLIQNDIVIGRMRMVSGRGTAGSIYGSVTVEPDDEATREFFKDDFTIPTLGKVVGLQYDGLIGRPMRYFTDEPDDRHMGTEIVDTLDFDFGIAHPRYASVKGWSSATNGPKLSIHTKHKHRRARSSNKIKKVS